MSKSIKIITSVISLNHLLLCLLFCTLLIGSKALASDKRSNLISKYNLELSQIENYLNNLHNLSANFTQITSSGSIANGKFYLSRPGKMRVEYDNKSSIIIVVNGPVLSYYDAELDEISNLRTNTTPASLLTRKNISFDAKDIDLIDVVKKDNNIKITLAKKNNPNSGNFSLIFSLNPINFLQMEIYNDLDEVIKVNLRDVVQDKKLGNDLFILKNKNR